MESDSDIYVRVTEANRKEKLQFPTALRERFEKECGFTDEELEILRLRARGKSILEISFAMNCGTERIDRRIRSIKNKIANVL